MTYFPSPTAATVDIDLAGVSGSYVAGDQMGTLITVANFADFAGQYVSIEQATGMDGNAAMGPCDLYIHSASITVASDSAADSISDADNLTTLTRLQFGGWQASALNYHTRLLTGIPARFVCPATSVYVRVVARSTIGTITGATVRFRLTVLKH